MNPTNAGRRVVDAVALLTSDDPEATAGRVDVVLKAFEIAPDTFRLGASPHPDSKRVDAILTKLFQDGTLDRPSEGRYRLGPGERARAAREAAEVGSHVTPAPEPDATEPVTEPALTATEPIPELAPAVAPPRTLSAAERTRLDRMVAARARFGARHTTRIATADVRDFWGTPFPSTALLDETETLLAVARAAGYDAWELSLLAVHVGALRRYLHPQTAATVAVVDNPTAIY